MSDDWRSTACLVWTGGKAKGYGVRKYQGRQQYVHRIAWMEAHGPIPPGMIICHRCDNPPCYNVEHLFMGTYSDNNFDAAKKGRKSQQQRTHCPRGHALVEPNLMASRLKRGHRVCRICGNEQNRDRKRVLRQQLRERPRAMKVCAKCGRVGYRNFMASEDGTSVICTGAKKCARRQRTGVVRPIEEAAA